MRFTWQWLSVTDQSLADQVIQNVDGKLSQDYDQVDAKVRMSKSSRDAKYLRMNGCDDAHTRT